MRFICGDARTLHSVLRDVKHSELDVGFVGASLNFGIAKYRLDSEPSSEEDHKNILKGVTDLATSNQTSMVFHCDQGLLRVAMNAFQGVRSTQVLTLVGTNAAGGANTNSWKQNTHFGLHVPITKPNTGGVRRDTIFHFETGDTETPVSFFDTICQVFFVNHENCCQWIQFFFNNSISHFTDNHAVFVASRYPLHR